MEYLDDDSLTNLLSSSDWGSALAVLWDRHAGLLYSAARAVCRADDDARDAISDALANIAQRAADGTLQITSSFKAYSALAVRNAALNTIRRTGRVDVSDDIDLDTSAGGPSFLPDPVVDDLETSFVATAFASLPERYRQVLWLTEVEGLPPREVADIVGLSANNVSQIAVRARTALREGWAAAHLTGRDIAIGCGDFVSQLPALVSGTLRTDRLNTLEDHLSTCVDCGRLRSDLMDDTVKLRGLALPIPAFLLFDQLRRSGGLGMGATQIGHVARTATTGVRRVVSSLTQLVAQVNTAVLVGVVSVASVALVGAGVYVVTSGNSGQSLAVSEVPADIGFGESGTFGDPTGDESSLPADGVVEELPIVDEEQVKPEENEESDEINNQQEESSTSGSDDSPSDVISDSETFLGLPGFVYTGPVGGPLLPPLTSNRITSLTTRLDIGASASWSFTAVDGQVIIARANIFDGLQIFSPTGNTVDCWDGCALPGSGSYTVTLRATSAVVPAGTEILISTPVPINLDQPVALEETLSPYLARLWEFEGTAGQVVALGISAFGNTVIRTSDGTPIGCDSPGPCVLPTQQTYYAAVSGVTESPGDCLPATLGFSESDFSAQNTVPTYCYGPTYAGSLVEVASVQPGTIPKGESLSLDESLLAGLYRIFAFDAVAGDVVIPGMQWNNNPIVQNWLVSPSGVVTGWIFGEPTILTESGRHLVVYRSDGWRWNTEYRRDLLQEDFDPAEFGSAVGTPFEITTSSGTLTPGIPVDVGRERPRGLWAFWTLDIASPSILLPYATPTIAADYLFNPSVYLYTGKTDFHGYSLNPSVSPAGRYYVTTTQTLATTQVVVGGEDPVDIQVDTPEIFTGSSAAFATTVWRFTAQEGDFVDGEGAVYRATSEPGSTESVSRFGVSTDQFFGICPCQIPATGTYYFVNFAGLPPTISATDSYSAEVLVSTARTLTVDVPLTLDVELAAKGRYSWVVPNAGGLTLQFPSAPIPGLTWYLASPTQICSALAPGGTCIVPSDDNFVGLTLVAGDVPVPIGTEILLSSVP